MLIGIIIMWAALAHCQTRYGYGRVQDYSTRSMFILLGYSSGPHFSKFVDWANDYYSQYFSSTDKIKDFNGGLDFSAGLRNRFSHNFAVEFDFGIHSTSIKKQLNGGQALKLDLNVAQFTVSPIIIFDFSDRQLVIPFVGAGISVYSMRLDHSIDYNYLHTKVALASNFMLGIDAKIKGKLWGDIRGDWTIGSAKMPISFISNQPESFTMSLNSAQFHIGIVYDID